MKKKIKTKYGIDLINNLLIQIQENSLTMLIKYDNWPLWALIKNHIYESILNEFIEDESENLFIKILSRRKAALYQIFNLLKSYFQWSVLYRSISKFTNNNSVVLLIDGIFRYKNCDNKYAYPFGESLLFSNIRKFNVFTIERNHRLKKRGQPVISPDLCEDFVSFAFPIKGFIFRDKELERSKKLLLDIVEYELKMYPDILTVIHRLFDSFAINYYIYSFIICKRKAKTIFNRLRPFAVLCTASYGIPWWVAAAKEMGIKVVEFQHGVIHKNQPQYNWPTNFSNKKNKLLVPDIILMWGQYWVDENLLNKFWSKKDLLPMGLVKMDEKRELYCKLVENSIKTASNQTVTYVYTSCKPIRSYAIEFLKDVLAKFKEKSLSAKLIIKLHPYEDSEYTYYNELKIMYPDYCEVYYDKDMSLYECFIMSDVHLSVYSAAILESIELGRPTLILNLPGKEYFDSLISKGIVHQVDSPTDLFVIDSKIRIRSEFWNKWVYDTKNSEEYLFSKNSTDRITTYLNKTFYNSIHNAN